MRRSAGQQRAPALLQRRDVTLRPRHRRHAAGARRRTKAPPLRGRRATSRSAGHGAVPCARTPQPAPAASSRVHAASSAARARAPAAAAEADTSARSHPAATPSARESGRGARWVVRTHELRTSAVGRRSRGRRCTRRHHYRARRLGIGAERGGLVSFNGDVTNKYAEKTLLGVCRGAIGRIKHVSRRRPRRCTVRRTPTRRSPRRPRAQGCTPHPRQRAPGRRPRPPRPTPQPAATQPRRPVRASQAAARDGSYAPTSSEPAP